MYLLWRVYSHSSPKRVTDLFGRACICCGGCTIVVLRVVTDLVWKGVYLLWRVYYSSPTEGFN